MGGLATKAQSIKGKDEHSRFENKTLTNKGKDEHRGLGDKIPTKKNARMDMGDLRTRSRPKTRQG